MAIVYGYFKDEEHAREAARRCEELGVTSAVLNNMDTVGPYVDDISNTHTHTMRRREHVVLQSGLIGAAVFGIIGFIIWFIMPGLHDKLFLAGPLMAALYGAAIGIVAGLWIEPRRHYDDEAVPADIIMHPASERVVVINTSDNFTTLNVEELLEAEGAIEVIHRAA
jgi:hypothetical protein